jgi:N-methylhydantoinase B
MLVLETPGGGGMGDIAKRDPEQVMADVRAGLVSTAAALSEYGVEVTDAPA